MLHYKDSPESLSIEDWTFRPLRLILVTVHGVNRNRGRSRKKRGRIMRRKDREVTDPEAVFEILNRCDTLRIAVSDREAPYVVPVSFGAERTRGRIAVYFHCARKGLKVGLLQANPHVCVETDLFLKYELTAHGITARYESVIGTGTCEFLTDPDEIRHGLKLICAHCGYPEYSPDRCRMLDSVYVGRITLDEITGKRNPPALQPEAGV